MTEPLNTIADWDPEMLDKELDRVITFARAARDAFIMDEFGTGIENLFLAAQALNAATLATVPAILAKEKR
jgi:hypothetical protein